MGICTGIEKQSVRADTEDIKDQIRSEIPVDRFAEPKEVAGVVLFLASERASYITGQVIDVNGGMHI